MKSRSTPNRKRPAWLAAAVMAVWSAGVLAQNLPVPGDCGGSGNRACPIGAPSLPIGEPVGAAGMAGPGGAGGYGAGAGGYGPAPAAGAYGGLGTPAAPPPENGFSWQQQTPDGARQTCRRGLDGVTVRCDEPTLAPQR